MLHYTLKPIRAQCPGAVSRRVPAAAPPAEQKPAVADIIGGARKDGIQAKLRLSQPGDRHEKEADRVAQQVVSGQPAKVASLSGVAAGDQTHRMCEECEEELQRKPSAAGAHRESSADNVSIAGLAGGGQKLAGSERRFFESRMGADFSAVRIHTDNTASAMASDISARAFTYRNHIGFARGEYNPGSSDGRRLLAHELTHVMQQAAGVGDVISRDCSRRNAGQCCRDAKSAGLDNGDAGGVVCCDGRKVACNWHWLPDGEPNDFIERIIETCVTEHELAHFDDIDECGETCPSLTRPNFRAGADSAAEECNSYRIELACLRRSLPLCDGLENDAHKRQCRNVIQNTWIADRERQVRTRCTS